MKALLQRVSEASVSVDGEIISAIDRGLLVFLGVAPDDGSDQIDWLVDKILGLRIFPDAEKPMNRSVVEVAGGCAGGQPVHSCGGYLARAAARFFHRRTPGTCGITL